jgi:hypothetical protein
VKWQDGCLKLEIKKFEGGFWNLKGSMSHIPYFLRSEQTEIDTDLGN